MRSCLFCKKEIRKHRMGEAICYNCEEGANLAHAIHAAVEQWMKCIDKDNIYWRRALFHVHNAANAIDKTLPLDKQARQLNDVITGLVKSVLSCYHRDDIIAGTLVIKEYARISIIQGDGPSPWFWATEMEVACIIQTLVASMSEDDFIGASLGEQDSGAYGFITAIVLARIQVLLRDNIDRYQYKHFTDNLMDFAVNLFEDQPLKEYFDRLYAMGPEEKPEDLEVEDKLLRRYLDSRSLLQEQIYSSVNEEVEKIFGFTFEDIQKMAKALCFSVEEYFLPVNVIRIDILFNKLEMIISKEKVENILKVFSINSLIQIKKMPIERDFELRSIHKTKGFVIFGNMDLLQNIDIFEKLVFSGHFLEMYLPGAVVPQKFCDAQNKMATLMSYKIADMFKSSGYLVPHETVSKGLGSGQVVRAEIGKILNGKDNILQGVGDIDVLALNPEKAEILLIELKYFKPGRTIKELVFNDANKIDGKHLVDKILARDKVVRKHIKSVLELFITDTIGDEIKIRSILVTARPNFRALQENLGIEYLTWLELERLIKSKQL